jgi:excinuclease ABC subunit B
LAVSEPISNNEAKELIKELEKEMLEAVKRLEFEKAALLRDQIEFLRGGAEKLRKAQAGGYQRRKKLKYGKKKKYGGKEK